MTVEFFSRSIAMKVLDRAGIKLTTTGSAVRLASVARHITDCTRRHSISGCQRVWIQIRTDDLFAIKDSKFNCI